MTPLDALDRCIVAGFGCGDRRRPGYVIERMPEETRAALRELTSDAARSMRPAMMVGPFHRPMDRKTTFCVASVRKQS